MQKVSPFVTQSPVFYGWVILVAGTLGMVWTSPGQTYAVSLFIEHFITELGLSRTLVSTLYMLGTLIGSLALPLVGRHIDRYGSRVMVVVITLALGLSCLYMSYIQNALMLGVGFIAIRLFGQGSLALVSQNVINRWWVRRRGMAMGISGVGMSLFGLGGFPVLLNWLIPEFGWRNTYVILGAVLLGGMLPLGWLLFRHQPEDYGLHPDGYVRPPKPGDVSVPDLAEENWTPAEALRTGAFWVLALAVALVGMLLTGLFFHTISIFKSNGLSAEVAALAFVPVAVTSAVVTLISGVLIDRIPARFLTALMLWFLAASLWLAQAMPSPAWAVVYGLLLGATGGLMGALHGVVWAKYFGRTHLGSITGIATTVLIAGSALGPLPLGLARDIMGNYNTVLLIAALLPLILGLVSLFFGKPSRQV